MEAGLGDRAGFARDGDFLAALHRLAALHEQFLGVAVNGGVAVAVLDDHEPTQRRNAAADIGDDAVGSREHRRAFGHRDLDAIAAHAAPAGPEAGDYAAADRPGETADQ